MSGHSKWSQIKRQKGIADQKRGLVFSKLSRNITLAVIAGGGITNPENNFRLRLAIDRARIENMPKVNIERAIEKGNKNEGGGVKEVVYEGFGPSGVTLVITAATDNPNRTYNSIKTVLEKQHAKMGNPNSVLHMYDKCGIVVFEKKENDEGQIFRFVDEIAAYDIEETDDVYIVYVPFEQFGHIAEHLGGLCAKTTDLFYRPQMVFGISSGEADKLNALIDMIESLDDVDKVYSNYEISSEA